MSRPSTALWVALLLAGCGEQTTELSYSHTRLVLSVPADVERVTLSLRRQVDGALQPVDVADLPKPCPCNGRSVDIGFPAPSEGLWVIAVGFDSAGPIARGQLQLDGKAGLHPLELVHLDCTDADSDGTCADDAQPLLVDCDDGDPNLSPLVGCDSITPEDVPPFDTDESDTGPPTDDGPTDTAEPDADEPSDTADIEPPLDEGAADAQTADAEDASADGADTTELGGFGESCVVGDDCASDWCVQTRTGLVCSQLCGECPEGFVCKSVPAGGGKQEDVCLPAFLVLCTPCESDADCLSFSGTQTCLPFPDGAGSFCGGDCITLPCPEGYLCTPEKECVPEGWACTCPVKAVEQALATACSVANEHGTCEGTRSCGPEGLSDCSAPTPTAETCDEVDNDCDGKTDEDLLCGSEPCASDPTACTGADPCVDVTCKGASCVLVPATACFGELDYLDEEGGCRRYRPAGQDGPDLCRIPSGTGLMGAPADLAHGPEHLVYEHSFFIMRREVTEAEFEAFIQKKPGWPEGSCGPTLPAHWADGSPPPGTGDYPVRGVCWEAAKAYCEWIGLELPTEAQWERAARGIDGRTYPWGEEDPSKPLAVFETGTSGPEPTGSHPAGAAPSGGLDMAGNVAEWVLDHYDEHAYCQNTGEEGGCDSPGAVLPSHPSILVSAGCPVAGECHPARGGAWTHTAAQVTTWRREVWMSASAPPSVGFRCGLSAQPDAPTFPTGCCPTVPKPVADVDAAAPSAAAGPNGSIAVLTIETLEIGKQFELRLRLFDDEASLPEASEPLAVLGTSLSGTHPRTVEWLATGDLLTVWEASGEVWRRHYTGALELVAGSELEVATDTAQSDFVQDAGVATWPDGRYVICWNPGARFSTFEADGTPKSGIVAAPGFGDVTPNDSCAVAVLGDGSLVAVWRDGASQTGHGRRFAFDGTTLGDGFQVGKKLGGGTPKDTLFGHPAVGAVGQERFTIAWSFAGNNLQLETRDLSGGLWGATAGSADVATAHPFRLAAGAGPWFEVFWTQEGLYRRAFHILPNGEPLAVSAPRKVTSKAADQSLRSLRRDRYGRLLITWTDADGKGHLQLVRD